MQAKIMLRCLQTALRYLRTAIVEPLVSMKVSQVIFADSDVFSPSEALPAFLAIVLLALVFAAV